MLNLVKKIKVDWYIIIPSLILFIFSLFTLFSFSESGDISNRFSRQGIWIIIGILIFYIFHKIDIRHMESRKITLIIYILSIFSLLILFISGHIAKGAQSWIRLGFFSIQPTDPAKLSLIMILAKYFSKRHVEISSFKHIFISGIYTSILGILILLQPDFGSAIVIFGIWAGMIFVSGISKKHILILLCVAIITLSFAWNFAFKEYQKKRIINFIHPMSDIRGSGYNQYQAIIAVGSGELFGKGIGYGTQSKLKFLPEYETDFIFAAFAEEWGFIGVIIVIFLYLFILIRMLYISIYATNINSLFVLGVFFFFLIHIIVNIGMNLGIMPVTGIPLPLMSYGGSHLIIEIVLLAIVSQISIISLNKGISQKRKIYNEFIGF